MKKTVQKKRPEYMLCYLSSDEAEIALANEYWSQTPEGQWSMLVCDLVNKHSIRQKDLANKLQRIASIHKLSSRCSWCRTPEEISSRSSLTSQYGTKQFARHQTTTGAVELCPKCDIEARLQIEKHRKAKAAEQSARIAALIETMKRTRPKFSLSDIQYADAVMLYCLLMAADGFDEHGLIGPLATQSIPLTASPEIEVDICKHLYQIGALIPDERSSSDAFEVSETETCAIDFRLCMWRLCDELDQLSFQQLLSHLNQIINKPPAGEEALMTLWNMTSMSECMGVLYERAKFYNFRNYAIGEKTRHAIEYALEKYSIPQVWSVIHSTTKSAAAYAQTSRNPTIAKNTVPGSIVRFVDLSLEKDWTVHNRSRAAWDKEAMLTTVFFSRILGKFANGFQTLKTGNIRELSSS